MIELSLAKFAPSACYVQPSSTHHLVRYVLGTASGPESRSLTQRRQAASSIAARSLPLCSRAACLTDCAVTTSLWLPAAINLVQNGLRRFDARG